MARINIYIDATESSEPTTAGERTLVGWFDDAKARLFEEGKRWNGQNNVGVISGLQIGSECLWLTGGQRWVREYDSSHEFDGPHYYQFITPDAAREWLLRNGDDDAVEELFGPIEEESGPEGARHPVEVTPRR